jgi:ABC-2 type transport system permease protein
MFQILTIARRELASLFYSPIAYVVLGLFALGTAMIFFMFFAPGAAASLVGVNSGLMWLMIFLVPAISMRLISEEFRNGTIETLMTSPISDAQVIVGKWLGAMGFLVTLLVPLMILTAVLAFTSKPDWGPIFTGFLGLICVGGLFLAIGTFASAVTQNQIIAFLLTVFIICMLTILMYFLTGASFVPNKLIPAVYYINPMERFADFNKGVLDLPTVIYFVSVKALFLFMAVKVLESRRWR